MSYCHPKPKNPKDQIKSVGKHLEGRYGKKKFYTVLEVKDANRSCNVQFDYVCWSHVVFNSHIDFDNLHRALGQDCSYTEMKSMAVSDLSSSSVDPSWIDSNIDISWLEIPDFSIADLNPFN